MGRDHRCRMGSLPVGETIKPMDQISEAVRYEAVNAMLLNEFLKEHRTVAELKDLTQKQQAMIAQQEKQIEALAAGLQKVGAQVEMSKPAPQMAADTH